MDFSSFLDYLRVSQNPGGLCYSFFVDEEKIDEAILALLYLGVHGGFRTWKSFDWDAMERLHEKGLISSPTGKAKSVAFSEEGLRRSKAAFELLFGESSPGQE